jgi:hypothetical protein
MLRALLLILEPAATWEKIFRARRGVVFILALYLLPLLLITSAIEGYGLVHWGKQRGQVEEVAHLKAFPRGEAVIFEAAQLVLSLLMVFTGAKMVKSIGETFHGRHNYPQAFATIAYGLSPLFLLRLLDALPAVPAWVTWGIGIILCIQVLYHGVPRMMEPDPTHAFGLFLMSALLLVVITGMVRFITWWYLIGKLGAVETIVSDLAARLPF